MELFKLFGTIAINGEAEAKRILDDIANKADNLAKKVSDKLDLKVKADASAAEREFESLSTTIAAQERVLEALKRDYSAVVLEQGKNSKSARSLAKEIKSVSGELQENRTKLQNADSAADKFDRTLNDLGNNARNTANGGFTVLKGAMANLVSQGFSRLIQAGSQLVQSAMGYNSSMEQYNTSFTVMTGSAEKAAEVTSRLGDIAATTPFELTDLADTTQLLMNYGLTADEAIERMTMLGDISQGNADKMNRIGMAYGQMSSAGKVHLEDVKQMIEAGFNPLQEISQTTGESMESLYERISKGKISVDEITQSMVRSTSEGGKYFGSMDMQSQTLQGRLSTLKDTVNASLGTALGGAMSRLSEEILPKVTAAIEKIDWEALGAKIAEVADKIIDLGLWVVDNWEIVEAGLVAIGAAILAWKVVGLIQSISAALKGMTIAQAALNLVMSMNPIGLIVAAIAALVAAFIVLWKKCDGFRNFWINLWDKIKGAFKTAVDWCKNALSKMAEFFSSKFNAIKEKATSIFSKVKEAITKPVEKARDAVKKVIDKIKGFFSFKWSLPKLKVPKFTITPAGWKVGDLLKGVKPKLSVKWHADAMKNGLIMDKPTLFGMDSAGRIHGAGEVGSETLVGTNSLLDMIGGAVRQETTALSSRMERIIELLAMFFPQIIELMGYDIVLDDGVLVGRLAPKINEKLHEIKSRNARGG